MPSTAGYILLLGGHRAGGGLWGGVDVTVCFGGGGGSADVALGCMVSHSFGAAVWGYWQDVGGLYPP